jgi:hypothetical protein
MTIGRIKMTAKAYAAVFLLVNCNSSTGAP